MPIGLSTAVIGAGVLGAGAAVYSSSQQSSAAKQAAATSAAATNQATATQLQMYNQTRSDLQPFVQSGLGGLSQLQDFLSPSGPFNSLIGQNGPISSLLGLGPTGAAGMNSTLQNYPGYQFALQQGQQAQDRSAASKGLLLSGGQLKDSQAYGQGMANQLYGTYLSQLGDYAGQLGNYGTQLSGLASIGENAAAGTGSAATAAGGQIGSALTAGAAQQSSALQNVGTASASGIAGAANNFGSLLTNSALQGLLNPAINPVAVSASPVDLGALGYQYSDRRLKDDVRKIGKTESGLNIYSFRMKGEPTTRVGFMADEVRQVAPAAVRRDKSGFDQVHYGKVSRLLAIGSTPLKRAA